MQKPSWEELLTYPCFLLNLRKRKDRLIRAKKRLRRAGFTNIIRADGVDGGNEEELQMNWKDHGSPSFDPEDDDFCHCPGKQGVALGHYNIWKHIITNQIPMAIVMEDDVEFHRRWKGLAPMYWKQTPCYFDIIFLGSQFIEDVERSPVLMKPTYCLHAYVITFHGACVLYDLCLRSKMGTRTIDCMIFDHMSGSEEDEILFQWWSWNGKLYPDTKALRHDVWEKRNCGLVFQDDRLGSDVANDTTPWPIQLVD